MSKRPRISEADLLIPTLRALETSPSGRLATTRLIGTLEALLEPAGEDASRG